MIWSIPLGWMRGGHSGEEEEEGRKEGRKEGRPLFLCRWMIITPV